MMTLEDRMSAAVDAGAAQAEQKLKALLRRELSGTSLSDAEVNEAVGLARTAGVNIQAVQEWRDIFRRGRECHATIREEKRIGSLLTEKQSERDGILRKNANVLRRLEELAGEISGLERDAHGISSAAFMAREFLAQHADLLGA